MGRAKPTIVYNGPQAKIPKNSQIIWGSVDLDPTAASPWQPSRKEGKSAS